MSGEQKTTEESQEFSPSKAERWAYELVAKFSYGGFLDDNYTTDKVTILIRDLLESYADQQNAALKESLAELIPCAEWQLKSTIDYLNAFHETFETEPEKFKKRDQLADIIDRAKKLIAVNRE